MNRQRRTVHLGIAAAALIIVVWTQPIEAQTFSSGSTGADGAFAPASNTALTLPASGVFNFTTVTIPSGVTVTFVKNAANTPVTILATGDVLITGVISVNGTQGANGSGSGPLFTTGAPGGPGGFVGGQGASRDGSLLPSPGQGPGGGVADSPSTSGGTYGAPASFVSLLPLFGGSGGGGSTNIGTNFSGASGGGGGGAIVIASSTKITVNGFIIADGGGAGNTLFGGGGSGGAIRLVAPQTLGTGTVRAAGGFGANAGKGRTRLEAFTLGFTGTTDPAASLGSAPGPVTAASNPALINLPTLTISSVGGIAAPAIPGGSYATPDVALPSGTTNPVPTTLTVTNTPVGTVFTVRLIQQFDGSPPASVSSTASTGTFSNSTATASVTFPTGEVSVLNALGSFTLPLLASLFIDGEIADRVMVAANFGEPSSLSLVTRSGKQVPVSQLSQADQLKVAMAFEAMRTSRQ